jgi:Bacterial mobilisation protein (MobC)
MARPRKAPEERRDDRISPRFTTAERAEVEENAAAYGISPAEFTRRRTLGYRLPDPAAVQIGQARLGSAFNRLAVNMNQIAHRLNAGERPSAVERELQDLIDRINAELDKVYGSGRDGSGPQL